MLLLRPLHRCWVSFRAHPRFSIAVLIFAMLAGVCLGDYALGVHHFRAAEAALDRWQYDDARAHVAWCSWLLPRSTNVLLLAARVERMGGDTAQAEAYLEQLGARQGEASEASQVEWVLLRCQQGEIDAVALSLNQAVSSGYADSGAILETMARTYFQESRLIESLVCTDRWIDIEPTRARAYDFRSGVYQVLGKVPEAIADCERALELDPQRSWVRLRLINFHLHNVDPDAALPHLDYLQAVDVDNEKTQSARARYLSLVGRTDEACDLLDAVYAREPRDEVALLTRAKLELQRNRATAAETWSNRLLELRPSSAEGNFTLYRSLQLQGRVSEAAAAKQKFERLNAAGQRLNKLLASAPSRLTRDPALGTELGQVFLELGHTTAGQVALFKVLDREPRYRPAHAALADYYKSAGDADKEKRHRAALASIPKRSTRP